MFLVNVFYIVLEKVIIVYWVVVMLSVKNLDLVVEKVVVVISWDFVYF